MELTLITAVLRIVIAVLSVANEPTPITAVDDGAPVAVEAPVEHWACDLLTPR